MKKNQIISLIIVIFLILVLLITLIPPPTPAGAAGQPAYNDPTFDVVAQALALHPDAVGDLARADEWDRYRMYVALDPAQQLLLGVMRVEVTNREAVPFDDLYFRLYPNHAFFGGTLTVVQTLVGGTLADTTMEQGNELVRVMLATPLAPGETVTVTMIFSTTTPLDGAGRNFGAHNQQDGIWAMANSYPVLARRINGAWDTRPATDDGDLPVTTTALYDVTVDVPPEYTLVSTGSRLTVEPLPHGPRRERFVTGPQREFFLAALYNYDQASVMVDGTRVVSYFQPEHATTGNAAAAIAAQSLQAFNARFGGYPFAELDVLQVPLGRYLGMEFPGAILIDDDLYVRGGRTFETTVVHEVGHQWWYGQVGSDQQGEPWLDESLASYMQVLYYESMGDTLGSQGELRYWRDAYLLARNRGNDAPLNSPAASLDGNYVSIVYGKGAVFHHALRGELGDPVYFAFLRDYYAAYRYGEATTADVQATAEAACGCDLTPFFNAWVYSAAPVPLP